MQRMLKKQRSGHRFGPGDSVGEVSTVGEVSVTGIERCVMFDALAENHSTAQIERSARSAPLRDGTGPKLLSEN